MSNTATTVKPVKSLGPTTRKAWANLTDDQRVAANAAIAAGTKPSLAIAQVTILAEAETTEQVVVQSTPIAKADKAARVKVADKVAGEASSTTTRRTLTLTASGDEKITADNLIAAAHAGTVTFYKVRENGSLRNWPLLQGKARTAAESLAARRADGESVPEIAKSVKASVPTVRRALTALAFTIEVESLSKSDAKSLAKEAEAARKN